MMVISIHALREEGDTESVDATVEAIKFLSTPSARRATKSPFAALRHLVISIHALREEGDGARTSEIQLLFEFLSTPSARRATTVQCRFRP